MTEQEYDERVASMKTSLNFTKLSDSDFADYHRISMIRIIDELVKENDIKRFSIYKKQIYELDDRWGSESEEMINAQNIIKTHFQEREPNLKLKSQKTMRTKEHLLETTNYEAYLFYEFLEKENSPKAKKLMKELLKLNDAEEYLDFINDLKFKLYLDVFGK